MVSTIPVTGTFSINTNEDSKDRILFTLQVAVKQIQHCCSLQSEGDGLTIEVREVRQLCESLDKTLFHGLKCCEKGYWSFVKEFTHSCTIDFLRKLKNTPTEVQCGRAWLSLALKEASLESYFRSFIQNGKIIKKYYKSLALLCDEQRMQLILMLMAGLENVPINVAVKKIQFGSGLSFFEGYSSSSRTNSYTNPKDSEQPSKLIFPELNPELLPCDNAAEVTIDFVGTTDKSPSNVQDLNIPAKAHKASLNKINTPASNIMPTEEFEMISHYINIDADSEQSESTEGLEVVRTKVVRRVKKAKPETLTCSDISSSESKGQSSSESITSLENRLSKVTTDSGLCLETPCSSDNDLSDDAKSFDGHQISFQFQQDINVIFSTPKKSSCISVVSNTETLNDKFSTEERGVPEGQEDPVKSICCNYDSINLTTDSTSRYPIEIEDDDSKDSNEDLEEEEISIYDLHKLSPVKSITDLSVDENLAVDTLLTEENLTEEFSNVSKKVDIVQEEMARLASEAPEILHLSGSESSQVTNNILLYFLVEVFEHEEEQFYKLYSGYSNFSEGFSQRIYLLLSNKSVYLIQPGNEVQKFFKYGSIRYSSINYIMVHLNYQGFKIVSRDKESLSFHTADAELTRDILSNLELGIRKFIPKLPLPSVFTNAETQAFFLSRFLASELNCDKSKIAIHHYVLARWEDYTFANVTPSGPIYQDYLMYRHKFVKENKATPWKPAYFLLKGGVLYCMENEKSKPLFFIQMCAPHCKGCRRIHLLNRPHAFEIIRSNSDSLQLAASDTLEASKWLQYFLESVALAGHFIDTEKDIQRPSCIILVNGQLVVTIEIPRRKSFKCLAKANICDLLTVFIDPVIPNFIMLEFEIAEASKSCGVWLIYFETLQEKEKFLNVIHEKWFEIYQTRLSVETLKDLFLLKRYRVVAEELKIEKLALQDFCIDD